MSSFATVLFIAVTWLADGTVAQSMVVPMVSIAECVKQKQTFDVQLSRVIDDQMPTLAPSFHSECKVVFNDSIAGRS